MSTNINRGNQSLSFDYKAKAKGQEFNKLLYSIVKPGIYKGINIIPTGLNFVSITPGFVFLNCSYQSETVRGTLARFSTQINSLKIEQTNLGEDEVVYLYFEYKEVVENWVGIYHKPVSDSIPAEAVIIGTLSYDGSGNITSVSYTNRQVGLLDEYSISDQNTYSNQIDKTKKSKLDLSKISTGTITTVSLPNYNYALSSIDDWQTARNYNVKEFVVYEGVIYRCVTAHTSTSFFTDLINWESLNNIQDKEIIRGFNNTASGLSKSRVVTIVGDNITEEIPEIDYISDYNQEPLGIVIQDINSGTSGELQQRGRLVLNGVDLSSGVVGQRVYSDSSGNLTMSITALEIGQLLFPDTVNPIIYVAILPTEEGLNVINFNGQLSTLENTIQKAFDRIDDYGYIPVWASGQTYRVSNVIVRPTDNFSLWACLTPHISVDFNSDILNWIQITDQTAIKYSDRKDIVSLDSNLSVSGGTNAVVQSVSLDFSNDPVFNSVSANTLYVDEINISNFLAVSGASGTLNDVDIANISFVKFYQVVHLTGLSAPIKNKIVIIYNDSDTDTLILNDSSLSLSQNRIITNNEQPLLLSKNKTVKLIYDSSIFKWRILDLDEHNELLINQTSHGFSENNYLIYDKTSSLWKLANSVGNYLNGTIGYVLKVVDVDNFIFHAFGKISSKTGLTAGEFYYVTDDGLGLTTIIPPLNQIQPILFSLPNNKIIELQFPSFPPINNIVPPPVGSVTAWDKYGNGTPLTLPDEYEECNGQTISDVSSPFNGKRIRNLNAKAVSSVNILNVDDINKIVQVSTDDIYAISIGDTLTFTGVVVPDAVVRSVNYTTGEIEVGDINYWTLGQFDLTLNSLTGATDLTSVGQPRFLKGEDVNGSNVNQFQGHEHYINLLLIANVAPFGTGSNTISNYTSTTFQTVSNGVDGTPRFGSKTQPDSQNIVWIMKVK